MGKAALFVGLVCLHALQGCQEQAEANAAWEPLGPTPSPTPYACPVDARVWWSFEEGRGSPDADLDPRDCEAGAAFAAPAVAGDLVYVGTSTHQVLALGRTTGAEVWRFDTGASVKSRPRVADGQVFVHSNLALFALDAQTGAELWSYVLPGNADRQMMANLGFRKMREPGPLVQDGMVFVGSYDGKLHAVDTSGQPRWVVDSIDEHYIGSIDATAAISGGVVFVGNSNGQLHAVDAGNGEQLWKYESSDCGNIFTSPVVAAGRVYFGCSDGARGGPQGSIEALDAATGASLWRFAVDDDVHTTPAVANGLVYFGEMGPAGAGRFFALDAETGEERWRYESVGTGGRWSYQLFSAEPAVAAATALTPSTVYTLSVKPIGGGGGLHALDAESGDLRWSMDLNGAWLDSESAPTLHTDSTSAVLYVGTGDGAFYALRDAL